MKTLNNYILIICIALSISCKKEVSERKPMYTLKLLKQVEVYYDTCKRIRPINTAIITFNNHNIQEKSIGDTIFIHIYEEIKYQATSTLYDKVSNLKACFINNDANYNLNDTISYNGVYTPGSYVVTAVIDSTTFRNNKNIQSGYKFESPYSVK